MPISFEPHREHEASARGALPRHGRGADAADLAEVRRATSTRLPAEWVDYFWKHGRGGPTRIEGRARTDGFVQVCVQAEELCWGDAALYLRMPTPALGGSAVAAAGTDEQKRALPLALPRRRARPVLGRHGDHGARRRLGRCGHRDNRRARRRRVGAQRHQDLLHQRRSASQHDGGLRGRLGDGRPECRARRHQVVRGAGEDTPG